MWLTRLGHEWPMSWHQHPDRGRRFRSVICQAEIAAIWVETASFSNRWSIRISHNPEIGLGLARRAYSEQLHNDV